MPNLFPSDFLQDVADIKKDAKQAKGAIGNRPPLTEASQGWILRAMSSPDADQLGSGDVWIFAQGGELWAMDSSGDEIPLQPVPEVPQGVAVANPPNFASGSASGEDAGVINQLRVDAAGTKVALDALIGSLRGAGLIASV